VELPLEPPLEPMLARLVRELPDGDFLFEPKWDGFRCIAFRDRDGVELRSRHDRPLGRYFGEIEAALLDLALEPCVLDGELLVQRGGEFDFAALMSRLHPAKTRAARLSVELPATLICFDLLALGARDLTSRPFGERRELLLELLAEAEGRVAITPATRDREAAAGWLDLPASAGIDGVVAKPPDGAYEPGTRAMLKVKRERTIDCVVGGFRLVEDGPAVASLLLGLYDESGRLEHIGVASSFRAQRRVELLRELRPLVVELRGHPWEHGFLLEGGPVGRLGGAAGSWTPDKPRDWIPLEPTRVCEVAYEHADNRRFRHPARFRRWRDDREARSCRLDQL